MTKKKNKKETTKRKRTAAVKSPASSKTPARNKPTESVKSSKTKKSRKRKKVTAVNPETAARREREGLPPMSKNSLKNLKPRRKGDPPLPGAGRPKGSVSLTKMLRELLAELPTKGAKRTRAEEFLRRAISFATAGDAQFAKIIFERAEGPVTQVHQVDANITSNDEHAIARRAKSKLDELREELRKEEEDEQEG